MQKPAKLSEALDPFEDHCWKDVIPPDVIAIDLYELVYQGGPKPVRELMRSYPSSCGEHAFAAIAPTKRLFAAARAAGLPIFYSTRDARAESQPKAVRSTRRQGASEAPDLYAIRPEFAPEPGDV